MQLLRPLVATLALALVIVPATQPRPAAADPGAITRNLILSGAAAAGALLIINHNQQVHQRYAQDARAQAQLQGERNDAQSAYQSERRAYDHESALVGEYKQQTALQQHELALRATLIARQQSSLSALKRQVAAAQTRAETAQRLAEAQRSGDAQRIADAERAADAAKVQAAQAQTRNSAAAAAPVRRTAKVTVPPARPATVAQGQDTVVSYGWGTL